MSLPTLLLNIISDTAEAIDLLKKKKQKKPPAFGFNIFPLLSIFLIADFCSYLYFYTPSAYFGSTLLFFSNRLLQLEDETIVLK